MFAAVVNHGVFAASSAKEVRGVCESLDGLVTCMQAYIAAKTIANAMRNPERCVLTLFLL